MKSRLCLASQSPRRAALLRQAGFDFWIYEPKVDESPAQGESPAELTERLSAHKAEAAAQAAASENGEAPVCLGSDTVVVLDDLILGKPADSADAARMLKRLSGRRHEVVTAVTVACGGWRESRQVKSEVTFCYLSDDVIRDYCTSAEPYDKAGAYAIQGYAGSFVESLSGSYSAVMGLPLCETTALLALAGIHPCWNGGMCDE
jgi:septum formation protein